MEVQDERLKSGMSCDVEIVMDRIPDALYVPVGAVFTEGDHKICYVVADGTRKPREVKTGRASEKYVEILEGLGEGQTVRIGDRVPAKKADEEETSGPGGKPLWR